MLKVFIKNRKRQPQQFQFFKHQFVEAAIQKDICPLREINTDGFFTRLIISVAHRIFFWPFKKKRAVIVTSSGGDLFSSSFPYYSSEIIPMIWDVWPFTWPLLFYDLKKLKCRLVFVTVRQVAEKIKKELGIEAVWIPEGIDISDYKKGEKLSSRSIDVYEMGRRHDEYHKVICQVKDKGVIKEYRGNVIKSDGSFILPFPTAADLLASLSKVKIITCFPQCDTNKERSGNLETLTQRYWEAMLSRCLIVGRAPQELIDVIGYNPVVDVCWENPVGQLEDILEHIDDYQELVDRNYQAGLDYASWGLRIDRIKEILMEKGYSFDY